MLTALYLNATHHAVGAGLALWSGEVRVASMRSELCSQL